MYLLYLDDSGSVTNPADTHLILAGVAVFERQPHWLSAQLDTIAARLWPDNPRGLEFRGSDMASGRKHWRGLEKAARLSAFEDALNVLGTSKHVRIFAVAIHKSAISPDDPMEYAFEQICNRFDRFLGRLFEANNPQRGLIILDKSSYETSLQRLATEFRQEGHRWGRLFNLTDVPMFVDSRATRMIQYADLVAYAVRRYFENGDASLFDIFSARLDSYGGVMHGLVHRIPPGAYYACLSCRQR